MLISNFDPWRSKLCSCPPKLTINPYSGCDHSCVYCYASSYVPNFSECHPKKELLQKLRTEASKLKGELVSIANSSDPYPRMEASAGITRKCLEILTENDCRIQIITKSSIVTRDVDLLVKVPSTVALTITTDDDGKARLLEPQAPLPSERIRALKDLSREGIPVSVRIDPIIPFVNDKPERLVEKLVNVGVKHITSSTYKVRPDNWHRFSTAFPEAKERLKDLYFRQGERIGGYTLLPKTLRLKLMRNLQELVTANGLKFGVCREGLSELNTAACDGSWLIPSAKR